MNNQPHSIKEEVLEKISEGAVRPRGRWHFLVRHAALWLPGIAVTALGALAIAGILFGAAHAGWRYRPYTHPTLASFLIEAVPLLWIIGLVLFGALIVRTLRLTASGYRYATGIILLISFFASTMLGAALFALDQAGAPNRIIRFAVERRQRMIWIAPHEGRIAGEIAAASPRTALLTDPEGNVWTLDTTELIGEAPVPGATVRIVGKAAGDRFFVACVSFPWEFSPQRSSPVPTADRARSVFIVSRHAEGSRCAAILAAQMPLRRTGERMLRVRP